MSQSKERLLHHVLINVFCKPHESKEEVLRGLDVLSPVPTAVLLTQEAERDPERPHTLHYFMPDIELTVEQTETDDGPMMIYTLFFKKMSAVNAFAKKFSSSLTKEEREEYSAEPDILLDADGKLSVRFDKELLMQGTLSLTGDGVCYQIKASIAAYPKNEENIKQALQRILAKTN